MIKNLKEESNGFKKSLINKIFTFAGISMLFISILMLYAFSIFKFLLGVSGGENSTGDRVGPLNLFNDESIDAFLKTIGFENYVYRYVYLFIAIGLILLALFTLTFNNLLIRKHDLTTENKIIVIHDDILETVPEEKTDGTMDYHPDKLVDNANIELLQDLFKRKGFYRIFLIILNIMFFVATGLLAYVFWAPNEYIFTDEARLLSNLSMVYFNIYFLFRCPDFLKSFAFMAFKKVNLGSSKFRMHETFLGILLAVAGIMLLINTSAVTAVHHSSATGYFETMCGIPPLVLGVFLIGRDWKDFAQGKFISD